jgi:hypothetical protein
VAWSNESNCTCHRGHCVPGELYGALLVVIHRCEGDYATPKTCSNVKVRRVARIRTIAVGLWKAVLVAHRELDLFRAPTATAPRAEETVPHARPGSGRHGQADAPAGERKPPPQWLSRSAGGDDRRQPFREAHEHRPIALPGALGLSRALTRAAITCSQATGWRKYRLFFMVPMIPVIIVLVTPGIWATLVVLVAVRPLARWAVESLTAVFERPRPPHQVIADTLSAYSSGAFCGGRGPCHRHTPSPHALTASSTSPICKVFATCDKADFRGSLT